MTTKEDLEKFGEFHYFWNYRIYSCLLKKLRKKNYSIKIIDNWISKHQFSKNKKKLKEVKE